MRYNFKMRNCIIHAHVHIKTFTLISQLPHKLINISGKRVFTFLQRKQQLRNSKCRLTALQYCLCRLPAFY